MKKYKKVTKEDVLKVFLNENTSYRNQSARTVAHNLETSQYQAIKYLRILRREGLIEMKILGGGTHCSTPNESDPEVYCSVEPPVKVWSLILI